MARLTHLYEPGMTYLLTTITHRRQKLFAGAVCAQAAYDDIAFYTRKFKAVSLAHVVMPDHLHWVICPSPEDFDRFAAAERARKGKYAAAPERFYLSKIMEDYKRHSSFVANKLRDTTGVQVWQDGFRDDALRSPEIIHRVVYYAVFNPVKAKLVARPENYPYLAWDAAWLD